MVNMIFLRSSGTFHALRDCLDHLDHLVLSTCRDDLLLSGGGEGGSLDSAASWSDLPLPRILTPYWHLERIPFSSRAWALTTAPSSNFSRAETLMDSRGLAKDVVETALGQAAGQRHLAALEARRGRRRRSGPSGPCGHGRRSCRCRSRRRGPCGRAACSRRLRGRVHADSFLERLLRQFSSVT